MSEKHLTWVKLSRYCELSGETSKAVHAKRDSGKFLDGVHCKIAPDGNLWINLVEVEKWVLNGNQATLVALQSQAKSPKRRAA